MFANGADQFFGSALVSMGFRTLQFTVNADPDPVLGFAISPHFLFLSYKIQSFSYLK
jgi:hypothetical protein